MLAPWVRQQLLYADPLRDGFVPKGSDVRDFSIICGEADGLHHVFYIDVRHGKSSRRPDNMHYIGHATTRDLVTWEVLEPALFIAPGTWEGAHVFAPHVVRIEPAPRLDRLVGGPARYAMFYVGQPSSLSQSLGMALSTDLTRWVRYEGNPILHPGNFDWAYWSRSTLANCRDPHVMTLGATHYLYYTALRADADACIAAARSTNLEDWTDLGPVLTMPVAESSPGMTESACVHEMPGGSGGFVLFYTQGGATRYSISDDPLKFDNPSSDSVLVEGLWGLELVERRAAQWLVALFRAQSAERPGAIVFGIISWSGGKPRFSSVKTPGDLAQFRTSMTSPPAAKSGTAR